MYKVYLKQAWALMGQNRFFTAVYIIGTGLAISMVMAIAVVYHIRTANIAPEVSRDRMGYVLNVSYEFNGGKGSLNSGCGPRFVKEVLYGLETPEKVAVTTNAAIMPYEVGDIFIQAPGSDESPKVQLMGCDDAFWQVYRFCFLDGKPFASAEFLSGMPRVVLDRSLARRLLGRTEVAGQTVLINDIEYTISGVVEDISAVASDVYAEAWVPYTSMASIMDTALEEREGSVGLLLANCLLRDASDLPALSAELEKGVRRYNSGLREGQVRVEPPCSFGDQLLSRLFGPETYIVLGVALFLFLLVPALNLSGLNASRMQDRVSELGVRKAFGASRKTLMGQVFWENMLLMLPGGMAGLLFSYVLVSVFRGILLSPGLHSMGSGAGNDIFLSPGMLLNMEVFAYAFAVCVALNLLSSMIPAWRTVRVSITDALNDK